MTTLTVVIPVYNAKKYLEECIGSVLDQTFRDYDIILVDDGSTDGSADLCDELASLHACVSVIHKANGGASSARNAGLKAAKGKFIHFIDSDDMLSGSKVYSELSSRAFAADPQIIFFRRERFTEGSREIDAVQPEYEFDGVFSGDVLRHVLEKKYQMTLTCPVNKIFKTEFLKQNDLYFCEGIDHEEDEWLPRVIACAQSVWFDKGVFYTVRNRSDSLSATPNEEAAARKACSKIKIAVTGVKYMEQKQLSPETMPLAAAYYWGYLTDACVDCSRFKSKENKRRVKAELKKNKPFFRSSRYLKSKNQRILGVLFRRLGVSPTVKLIGIRYGK